MSCLARAFRQSFPLSPSVCGESLQCVAGRRHEVLLQPLLLQPLSRIEVSVDCGEREAAPTLLWYMKVHVQLTCMGRLITLGQENEGTKRMSGRGERKRVFKRGTFHIMMGQRILTIMISTAFSSVMIDVHIPLTGRWRRAN